jgi:outer membrane protein OmpA-like peptidoglycan-associated protein/tetratricopeptide (TPR) repeat protein
LVNDGKANFSKEFPFLRAENSKMKYFLSICIVLFLVPVISIGQVAQRIKDVPKKAFRYYKEAEGNRQEGHLDKAFRNLERALEEAPNFIDALERAADIGHDLGKFEASKAYYERIIALLSDPPEILYYKLGIVCFKNKDFETAETHLTTYLEKEDPGNRTVERAKKYLRDAIFSKTAIQQPVEFDPQRLGSAINTEASEYLPSISVDGQTLIFTRFQNRDENFFYASKVDTGWQVAQPLTSLNTAMNEASQTVSADGRLFIFTACNRKDGQGSCDLYFTEQMPSGQWTRPANLGAPVNTKAWESLAAVSSDGRTLFFSSDRPGGSGGRDIWFTTRKEDGSWNEPLNAGPNINTPDWEQSPFLHPDGQTLYFMSNGWPGFGDFDLFVSRKVDGVWQKPENLGYPINTAGNEGSLFIDFSGKKGYFSTDVAPGVDPATLQGTSIVGSKSSDRHTDIYVFDLPPSIQPNPVTYTRVTVVDAETGKPLQADLRFYNLSKEAPLLTAETDVKGTFLYVLPLGQNYALHINKEGYLFHSENFSLEAVQSLATPFEIEIELQPIPDSTSSGQPSRPVVLKNVFFETASASLLPASRNELDRLKKLLEERPGMQIQINGHTDNVGKEADNLDLSTRRAKAVYQYLVENGIDPNRLAYKGFGEQVPVADNDTPGGRQQNRRTEFQVLQ